MRASIELLASLLIASSFVVAAYIYRRVVVSGDSHDFRTTTLRFDRLKFAGRGLDEDFRITSTGTRDAVISFVRIIRNEAQEEEEFDAE